MRKASLTPKWPLTHRTKDHVYATLPLRVNSFLRTPLSHFTRNHHQAVGQDRNTVLLKANLEDLSSYSSLWQTRPFLDDASVKRHLIPPHSAQLESLIYNHLRCQSIHWQTELADKLRNFELRLGVVGGEGGWKHSSHQASAHTPCINKRT